MKKSKILFRLYALVGLLLSLSPVMAINVSANKTCNVEALHADFLSPPDSAKPQVWWHWINGNVNREGITADLEAMARVGLGGATIFNVSGPNGPVAFNSPEWHALATHAMAEAKRLGLKLDLQNDAGWTGSGGPWITPELSMQKVVWSEVVIEGGKLIEPLLPRPETLNEHEAKKPINFYRDIAVLAFPSRQDDELKLDNFAPKFTTSGTLGKNSVYSLPAMTEQNPQHIQIETVQPFTARQLTAHLGCRYGVSGVLEVSDDGKNFKTVTAFKARPPQLRLDFERVSGRFFRLRIFSMEKDQPKVEVSEIALTSRYVLQDIQSKSLKQTRHFTTPKATWPIVSADIAIPTNAIIDLTKMMDANGKLTWEAPTGRWTIVRLGCTITGKENHPAPPSGLGLECDKLSKEAIRFHFENLLAKLIAENKGLVGRDKTFAGVIIESWEVGSQNWTPKMREEFQRLRGYDMSSYLLTYCGRVVESIESTERFLWDLRKTIGDLIAQNYAGEMRRLVNAHDMDLTIEASDTPADDSSYGGQADIPMGECWSWGEGKKDRPNNLSLASLAMACVGHTHGRRIIATEAFTAHIGEAWQEHPGNMKALGDVAFCSGINRFIFHRYAMQPFSAARPGMTLGWWGVHYERTQTWWEQSKAWHEYVARCQHMLQQGLFVADVLYLQPEGSPRPIWNPSGVGAPPNVQGGFNYDVCNADVVLERLSVQDGRLTLPDGMSYQMMVLPSVETMTLGLLRKLKDLAEGGATLLISSKPPIASPTLAEIGAGDEEVKKMAAELWPRLVSGKTPAQVLAERGIKPDFISEPLLRAIHRSVDDTEVYFVANPESHSLDARASFRVTGRKPELWWPETGKITPVWAYEEKDGRTTMALHLEQLGSVFVLFRPAESASSPIRSIAVNGRSLVPDLSTAVQLPPSKGLVTPTINHEAAIEPPPTFDISRGLIWRSGTYVVENSGRMQKTLQVDLPVTQEISGSWQVNFDPAWGPFKAQGDRPAGEFVFQRLVDWSKRPEEALKYYSGSALYRKQFDWNPAGDQTRFYLDLGKVAVTVEVRLNGKAQGILWKPPFRVDVTEALKPGTNELELKVVNLWVNRMIGDEQIPREPEPYRGNNPGQNKWPDWLLEGKSDPAGRYTFATCRSWSKDEPLAESGLLGPVILQAAFSILDWGTNSVRETSHE